MIASSYLRSHEIAVCRRNQAKHASDARYYAAAAAFDLLSGSIASAARMTLVSVRQATMAAAWRAMADGLEDGTSEAGVISTGHAARETHARGMA